MLVFFALLARNTATTEKATKARTPVNWLRLGIFGFKCRKIGHFRNSFAGRFRLFFIIIGHFDFVVLYKRCSFVSILVSKWRIIILICDIIFNFFALIYYIILLRNQDFYTLRCFISLIIQSNKLLSFGFFDELLCLKISNRIQLCWKRTRNNLMPVVLQVSWRCLLYSFIALTCCALPVPCGSVVSWSTRTFST